MTGHDFRRRALALAVVVCLSGMTLGAQTQAQGRAQSDHRDRFKQYKDMRNIRDVDPSTLAPAGDPRRIIRGPGLGTVDSSGRVTIDYLREYGCAADLVVTARLRPARFDFTAEGTFIFTTYDVDVETVIRGDTALSGSAIRVIWPGGSLVHNGRPISTIDASYRLPMAGRKYLLFLHRIGQGEFETIQQTAGYDVTGDHARGLGAGTLRETLKSHLLLSVAQAAVSGCNR